MHRVPALDEMQYTAEHTGFDQDTVGLVVEDWSLETMDGESGQPAWGQSATPWQGHGATVHSLHTPFKVWCSSPLRAADRCSFTSMYVVEIEGMEKRQHWHCLGWAGFVWGLSDDAVVCTIWEYQSLFLRY